MEDKKFWRMVVIFVFMVVVLIAILTISADAKAVNPKSPMFASRSVRTSKSDVLKGFEKIPVVVAAPTPQPTRDPQNPYTVIEIPCGPDQELICTSRGGGR